MRPRESGQVSFAVGGVWFGFGCGIGGRGLVTTATELDLIHFNARQPMCH
jgi:hypothetical protein